MNTQSKRNVSTSVMEQIKNGRIHMHSKVYFTALAATSIAFIAVLAGLIAYLMNILFFWVRIQTAGTMAWGARANLSEALSSFPWWAIGLVVLLLVLSIWLLKKQGTMYRYKTRTLVLLIMLASTILGFSLSLTTSQHTPGQPLQDSSRQHVPGRQR